MLQTDYVYPPLASEDDFECIYKFTSYWERDFGEVTNSKYDNGGLTKRGITLPFLTDLPKELADLNHDGKIDYKDIYKVTPEAAKMCFRYGMWIKGRAYVCPPLTAMAHFDFGVNSGSFRASQKLQNAINKIHPSTPLKVDGLLGPASRAVLIELKSPEWDMKLSTALIDEREAFLRRIAANSTKQAHNLKGWLNRVNALRKFLKELDYYGKK